jgi:hypothetical protein
MLEAGSAYRGNDRHYKEWDMSFKLKVLKKDHGLLVLCYARSIIKASGIRATLDGAERLFYLIVFND